VRACPIQVPGRRLLDRVGRIARGLRDGTRLASGDELGFIQVWDLKPIWDQLRNVASNSTLENTAGHQVSID
jgi:hypothetical protein